MCIMKQMFIILILLALLGCAAERKVEKEEPIRPAKLLELGSSDEISLLSYPAVIDSQEFSDLSFELGGVVQKLMVDEAQRVKAGDVLASLDSADLKSRLNSALAQLDNAKAEYERAERLFKEDAISKSELEKRKSQLDVNQASHLTSYQPPFQHQQHYLR